MTGLAAAALTAGQPAWMVDLTAERGPACRPTGEGRSGRSAGGAGEAVEALPGWEPLTKAGAGPTDLHLGAGLELARVEGDEHVSAFGDAVKLGQWDITDPHGERECPDRWIRGELHHHLAGLGQLYHLGAHNHGSGLGVAHASERYGPEDRWIVRCGKPACRRRCRVWSAPVG